MHTVMLPEYIAVVEISKYVGGLVTSSKPAGVAGPVELVVTTVAPAWLTFENSTVTGDVDGFVWSCATTVMLLPTGVFGAEHPVLATRLVVCVPDVVSTDACCSVAVELSVMFPNARFELFASCFPVTA